MDRAKKRGDAPLLIWHSMERRRRESGLAWRRSTIPPDRPDREEGGPAQGRVRVMAEIFKRHQSRKRCLYGRSTLRGVCAALADAGACPGCRLPPIEQPVIARRA